MTHPQEILTYAPPGGEFLKADYPWLQSIRACVRGGDGGAASDGSPGGPGETNCIRLTVDEIPEKLTIQVARGGRGAPGAEDGEDGFVLIELYGEPRP